MEDARLEGLGCSFVFGDLKKSLDDSFLSSKKSVKTGLIYRGNWTFS
jgi:hypothetical protein